MSLLLFMKSNILVKFPNWACHSPSSLKRKSSPNTNKTWLCWRNWALRRSWSSRSLALNPTPHITPTGNLLSLYGRVMKIQYCNWNNCYQFHTATPQAVCTQHCLQSNFIISKSKGPAVNVRYIRSSVTVDGQRWLLTVAVRTPLNIHLVYWAGRYTDARQLQCISDHHSGGVYGLTLLAVSGPAASHRLPRVRRVNWLGYKRRRRGRVERRYILNIAENSI